MPFMMLIGPRKCLMISGELKPARNANEDKMRVTRAIYPGEIITDPGLEPRTAVCLAHMASVDLFAHLRSL